MDPMKTLNTIVLLASLVMLLSCKPEPAASVDYIIKNSTDSKIVLHLIHSDSSTESYELGIQGSKTFYYYYEDIEFAPDPFSRQDIDTITLQYQGTILKKYHSETPGKNPFKLKDYTGEQTDYENGILAIIFK
jgi:hypothetical protein